MAATPVYDALAEGYDQGVARITGLHAHALVAALELAPGSRALDIAAGTGAVTEVLAEVVAQDGLVVAADIAAGMLRVARRRLDGRFPQVQIVRMAAESPAIVDGAFDGVSCGFGIMHMANPDAALRAMRRLLRPGGRCALTVWAPTGERIQSPVDEAFALVLGGPPPSPHGVGFSAPGVLARALREAGFSGVQDALSQATLAVTDLDEWWETVTSGRLGVRLRELGEERANRVRAAAYRRAEQFATREGNSWRFPAGALLAVGVAP